MVMSPIQPARRVTVQGGESKLSQFFGEHVELAGITSGAEVDDLPIAPPKLTFLDEQVDARQVLYGRSGDLRGATLPILVHLVTSHKSTDAQIMHQFLLMYRTFAQPD